MPSVQVMAMKRVGYPLGAAARARSVDSSGRNPAPMPRRFRIARREYLACVFDV